MTNSARVSRWLHDDFGIAPTSMESIADGLDEADVWCAATADGATYAVKWSAGGTDAGLLVPAALAGMGCQGVAAPVPTRDDRLWSSREGRRLSVTPWAAGASGWSTPLCADQWAVLGRTLRAAHDLVPGDAMARKLPRESYDPSAWLERSDEVDERLASPRSASSGMADDDVIRAVRRTWTSARSGIVAARGMAAELSDRLRDRPVASNAVVCHADSHGGNLILRGTAEVVLLDWDDAMLAPPERDLMFAMSPSVWFCLGDGDDGAARAGFVDGYGAGDLDREMLTFYRCVRAIEDVTELAEWALDPEGAARDRAVNLLDGVVAPGGQLDAALVDT